MGDFPYLVAVTITLWVVGILLTFYSKETTMYFAKTNLWFWYRFFPEFTTKIWGEKEDLEHSLLTKVAICWHRLIGVFVLFLAVAHLVILFGGL